jgi:predicted DsbA family dithiol-disulfide isomerase
MDAEQTITRVRADIERGRRAQVQATPTIVINGRRVEYWHHTEILRAIIREELQRTHTHQVFTTNHFRRPYETQ